jgi:hypothetical protein
MHQFTIIYYFYLAISCFLKYYVFIFFYIILLLCAYFLLLKNLNSSRLYILYSELFICLFLFFNEFKSTCSISIFLVIHVYFYFLRHCPQLENDGILNLWIGMYGSFAFTVKNC